MFMEIESLQINIKIVPKRDSAEDIRKLILSLIDTANDNYFAIDSANIGKEQVFESSKGFVNRLEIK